MICILLRTIPIENMAGAYESDAPTYSGASDIGSHVLLTQFMQLEKLILFFVFMLIWQRSMMLNHTMRFISTNNSLGSRFQFQQCVRCVRCRKFSNYSVCFIILILHYNSKSMCWKTRKQNTIYPVKWYLFYYAYPWCNA